jgi:DNA (cytosine-5)-methyltransferase 1
MVEFIKIEDRGAGLVAVLRNGVDGRDIAFNRESLEQRISNLKKYECDTSVEADALAKLIERQSSEVSA